MPTRTRYGSGEILAAGPVTDDGVHAEALAPAAPVGRAQAGAGDRPVVRGNGPSPARMLPAGSARQALESLCDFIADRTS